MARNRRSNVVFHFLLAAGILAAASQPAAAQSEQPRPTVTRAADLIEPAPPRVPVGTLVLFKPKAIPEAQKLARAGLQVRVFALGNTNTPTPDKTLGNCHVFASTVYPLDVTPEGGIRFTTLDETWLNPSNSRKSIKEGRYLLVFEQRGAPGGEFRLRVDSALAYFQTGLTVSVFSKGAASEAELLRVLAAHDERRSGVGSLIQDKGVVQVPCYRYVPLRVSAHIAAHAAAHANWTPLEPCTSN